MHEPASCIEECVERSMRALIHSCVPCSPQELISKCSKSTHLYRYVLENFDSLQKFLEEKCKEVKLVQGLFCLSLPQLQADSSGEFPAEISPQETARFLTSLKGDQLGLLNSSLKQRKVVKATSEEYLASQRIHMLDDLRRKKQAKIEELEKQRKNIEELENKFDCEALERKIQALKLRKKQLKTAVVQGEPILRKKLDLEEDDKELDRKIEEKEDLVERIKIQIRMKEEQKVMSDQGVYFDSQPDADLRKKMIADQEKLQKDTKRALMTLTILKNKHAETCIHNQLMAVKAIDVKDSSQEREEDHSMTEKSIMDCVEHLEKQKTNMCKMSVQLLPKINEGQADIKKVKQIPLWNLQKSSETMSNIVQQPVHILPRMIQDEPPTDIFTAFTALS